MLSTFVEIVIKTAQNKYYNQDVNQDKRLKLPHLIESVFLKLQRKNKETKKNHENMFLLTSFIIVFISFREN